MRREAKSEHVRANLNGSTNGNWARCPFLAPGDSNRQIFPVEYIWIYKISGFLTGVTVIKRQTGCNPCLFYHCPFQPCAVNFRRFSLLLGRQPVYPWSLININELNLTSVLFTPGCVHARSELSILSDTGYCRILRRGSKYSVSWTYCAHVIKQSSRHA